MSFTDSIAHSDFAHHHSPISQHRSRGFPSHRLFSPTVQVQLMKIKFCNFCQPANKLICASLERCCLTRSMGSQNKSPLSFETNSPVSQLFPRIGEQSEQRILAHKAEQPTTGCKAIFHKYCCYIKHSGIIRNLTLWNPWGYVTYMSKCCNAGIWIRIYHVLCSETYGTFGGLVWPPTGSQQAARSNASLSYISVIICV